jgi:hypothetical protein
VRRPGQHRVEVFGREVRSQHAQGGQGQGALGEPVEDHREPAADPRDLDAVARGVLRHVEGAGAVVEKRPVAQGQVEARPQLEHRKVRHQLGGGFAFGLGQGANARKEVAVRQRHRNGKDIRIHTLLVARVRAGQGQECAVYEE